MKIFKFLIGSLALSFGIANSTFAFEQPGESWITMGVLICLEDPNITCFTDWNDDNKTFKSGGTYDIYLGMGSWESGVVIWSDEYSGKTKSEISEMSGGSASFSVEIFE